MVILDISELNEKIWIEVLHIHLGFPKVRFRDVLFSNWFYYGLERDTCVEGTWCLCYGVMLGLS